MTPDETAAKPEAGKAEAVKVEEEEQVAPVTPVAPAILALKGDTDYGEYLSSECVTCHRADGGGDGIPSITGWDAAAFVTALHAYKSKHRDHPVMQLATSCLIDEEIAGLAAFFANQQQE